MKKRTYLTAASDLPKHCRKDFIRLWKAAGVFDLYDGDLSAYLGVAAQQMELLHKQKRTLLRVAKRAKELIETIKDDY